MPLDIYVTLRSEPWMWHWWHVKMKLTDLKWHLYAGNIALKSFAGLWTVENKFYSVIRPFLIRLQRSSVLCDFLELVSLKAFVVICTPDYWKTVRIGETKQILACWLMYSLLRARQQLGKERWFWPYNYIEKDVVFAPWLPPKINTLINAQHDFTTIL